MTSNGSDITAKWNCGARMQWEFTRGWPAAYRPCEWIDFDPAVLEALARLPLLFIIEQLNPENTDAILTQLQA